jgi:hypothetical protein
VEVPVQSVRVSNGERRDRGRPHNFGTFSCEPNLHDCGWSVCELDRRASRSQRRWLLLTFIATLSLLASILNLIPFRTGSSYSEGAQIYQILSKGPWGDYHRALSIARSTLVTLLGPRDYDIEAIQRAAVSITHGPRGLHLRLPASSYYLDCDHIPEAIEALAQAEAVYQESASEIPVEWHTVFVFGKAFLQRDGAGARLWWERMEAKKPSRFNGDYWMAHSALLWSENRLEETQESWQKGDAVAQQLPNAGAYEADQNRFTLLRKALDESLSAHLTKDPPARQDLEAS